MASLMGMGGNVAGITGENWMEVQGLTKIESQFMGVTADERLAISHIFDRQKDRAPLPEQPSGILPPKDR